MLDHHSHIRLKAKQATLDWLEHATKTPSSMVETT
jgi:hypothetical protein